MNNRFQRAAIAQETVEILRGGRYRAAGGNAVELRAAIDRAVSGSVLYRPGEVAAIKVPTNVSSTQFTVVNTGTLTAAAELLRQRPGERVAALNFASAKNPGGGFLFGSQAQEEALARASALYACIEPMREMYETNRRFDSCLYTDHRIYSPDVPVFRGESDELLDEPFLVSMITSPAVNAGAIRRNEPENIAKIEPVMRNRMTSVLSVAAHHGHRTLILGAWGCGVFQNSPDDVAQWFRDLLTPPGRFASAFDRVVFAVLDRTDGRSIIALFARIFAD